MFELRGFRRAVSLVVSMVVVVAGACTVQVLTAPSASAAPIRTIVCVSSGCSVEYPYTGATETFAVPAGVSSLTVTDAGAQGGRYSTSVSGVGAPGLGGTVSGTLAVSSGQQLTVLVGQAGAAGRTTATFGGGGAVDPGAYAAGSGGGGSFVFSVSGAVLLAAGGGGGGERYSAQGGAGSGATTSGGSPQPTVLGYDGTDATGGSQTSGGAGGTSIAGADLGDGSPGSGPAASGQPGAGGAGSINVLESNQAFAQGAGGGGGYYGGGGGGYARAGAGGSGFAAAALTGVTSSDGNHEGDGTVTISWARTTPSMSVNVTPTSSTQGDTVYIQVVVLDPAGRVPPTGTVRFFDGATQICGTVTLPSSGSIGCATGLLAVGSHDLKVSYGGDLAFTGRDITKTGYQVSYAPLQITTSALVGGAVGQSYSVPLTATGGKAPYTWSASPGDLPDGLSVTPGGVLTGTPTHATFGPVIATLRVTDSQSPAITTTVSRPLTIAKGTQSIDFTSVVPVSAKVGTSYLVTTRGGDSGNPVAYTIDPSTAGNCTIVNGTVSLEHIGNCIVIANQAGNADYTAAPSTAQPVAIGSAGQTITFTSTPPSPLRVWGYPYRLSATGGGSGNPVTFAIGAGTTNGACSLVGDRDIFPAAAGTCVVTANQAGNADYDAAAQVTQTFEIERTSQSISFLTSAPASAVVGGPTYTPYANGGSSGSPVTFAIGPDTSNSACTLSAGVVRFIHAGECQVVAAQAGNNIYDPAPTQSQTFAVGKGTQTVTFSSTPPVTAVVDGATYTPAASGGVSGNPVTFSIGSGTTNNACTLSGGTVSFLHAGTCVVAADQPGNDDYEAAAAKTQSISVQGAPQDITFTTTPPSPAVVDGSYIPAAAATSGGGVVFSIDVATTNYGALGQVCSISAGTVLFDHVGTCVVAADQPGDADHESASRMTQSVDIVAIGSAVTVAADQVGPVYGQSVTATATITTGGGTPVGTVQFVVDGHSLGDPVSVTGGRAQSQGLLDSAGGALMPGTHSFRALFTPADQTVYAGADGSGSVTVARAATSTAVALSPDAITATVSSIAPGAGEPTGQVVFFVAGVQVGTADLDQGRATLAHAVQSKERTAVAVEYAGDIRFTGSSASTTRTNPVITAKVTGHPQANKAGWYRGTVTVSFTCAPGTAPLLNACPAPVKLTGQRDGLPVTKVIRAADGGIATVVTGPINIDRTAPRVKVTGVKSGRTYETAPTVRCVATDGLSGIKQCTISTHISSTATGTKVSYVATAIDIAANKTTTRGFYTLRTVTLEGTQVSNGRVQVHLGNTYRLVVTDSSSRPVYYLAELTPRIPHLRGPSLVPAGRHRWAITIRIDPGMSKYPHWNIGVRYNGHMHLIPVTVHH